MLAVDVSAECGPWVAALSTNNIYSQGLIVGTQTCICWSSGWQHPDYDIPVGTAKRGAPHRHCAHHIVVMYALRLVLWSPLLASLLGSIKPQCVWTSGLQLYLFFLL